MKVKAREITKIVSGYSTQDNMDILLSGFGSLKNAKLDEISFFSNAKYLNDLINCKAAVIIVCETLKSKISSVNKKFIVVKHITIATNKVIKLFNKNIIKETESLSNRAKISNDIKIGKKCFVDSFVTIESNCQIGDNVKIFSNCYIGKNVKIGKNSIIFSGAKILENSVIGEYNIISCNAVIGSDGFGYKFENNKIEKIIHTGNVKTGNYVEIGANSCVDKATFDSTIISDHVKIDNLVQIAHNVQVGKSTMIAGNVAVAGSTKIGKNCLIGGSCSIAGHLVIGDNVRIAGHSGVGSNIKSGSTFQGSLFAYEIRKFQRSNVLFKKLPEILKRLEKIESKNYN